MGKKLTPEQEAAKAEKKAKADKAKADKAAAKAGTATKAAPAIARKNADGEMLYAYTVLRPISLYCERVETGSVVYLTATQAKGIPAEYIEAVEVAGQDEASDENKPESEDDGAGADTGDTSSGDGDDQGDGNSSNEEDEIV